jgi:putative SOS response-associated peptidase YedK
MTPEEFEERFGFPMPEALLTPPSYNIVPFQDIPVIYSDRHGLAQLRPMFWQLIPSFEKEFKSKYKMINTRVETLKKGGFWLELLKYNRCAIPANSFYEWAKVEDKRVDIRTGKTTTRLNRIPHKFELIDESLMTFGGIYSIWRDSNGKAHYSCSIITTPANALVENVHPRMPFILSPDTEKKWLDSSHKHIEDLKEIIAPFPTDQMKSAQVSQAVNNPRNDSPDLIKAVDPDT